MARARKHFGRPSSTKKRYGVGCRVKWKRIGLTIDLLNLGGRDPCRYGYVQAGRVDGRHAARWAGFVGAQAGWSTGTQDAFLEDAFVGEAGEGRRWTLAEIYVPYGDGGYIPSLSALLDRNGNVRGFEFWVGAGGE